MLKFLETRLHEKTSIAALSGLAGAVSLYLGHKLDLTSLVATAIAAALAFFMPENTPFQNEVKSVETAVQAVEAVAQTVEPPKENT
jgi:hypothetical protein